MDDRSVIAVISNQGNLFPYTPPAQNPRRMLKNAIIKAINNELAKKNTK